MLLDRIGRFPKITSTFLQPVQTPDKRESSNFLIQYRVDATPDRPTRCNGGARRAGYN